MIKELSAIRILAPKADTKAAFKELYNQLDVVHTLMLNRTDSIGKGDFYYKANAALESFEYFIKEIKGIEENIYKRMDVFHFSK